MKQETAGTMQLGRMQEEAVNLGGLSGRWSVVDGGFRWWWSEKTWAGVDVERSHFKERSKSVSMM